MSVIDPINATSAASSSKALAAAVLRLRAQGMLDFLVAIWIFSGSFVFIEPSPYELTFIAVLLLTLFAGLGLYRSTLGLLGIILGFIPFALIACFQVRFTPLPNALLFSLVTIFLMITSYFLANYVAEDTEKRMAYIMNAYTITALVSALTGTLSYLGFIPGAEIFTLHGRAKAAFNDPNVFAPFLILPAMFALQRVLLGKGRTIFIASGIYMVLFIGVFVSFSRAAWGHFVLSSLIVLVLCFWLEANARQKLRIMLLSLTGLIMLSAALAGLLSIPAVSSLFETRAASQSYDSGETGRFGRQGYAFELALANPLGLGPQEFHQRRIIEAPHNVYVTVLHAYGWGGGAFYYLLVILTLWKGFASFAHPSPYRQIMIPLIATYAVVILESAIIDTDHWRHYFLLVGLIWGVSTAIHLAPSPSRRPLPDNQIKRNKPKACRV